MTELRVDAHVHVYPFMSIAEVLEAAGRNLVDDAYPASRRGVLMLADPEGVRGFERFVACARAGSWRRVHADTGAVTFRRDGGAELAVLRGQQLVSSEGLEVLGSGCRARLPSGLPLAGLVERIHAAGGLAILPWGVGKWLGRRGRLVDRIIVHLAGRPDVALADNAGRPRLWSHVPQFAAAAERGMRVLAGTDPLPLPGEERRIGSYAFRVRLTLARAHVSGALREALARPEVPIEITGRRVTARDFAASQLRLRLRRGPAGQRAA